MKFNAQSKGTLPEDQRKWNQFNNSPKSHFLLLESYTFSEISTYPTECKGGFEDYRVLLHI